MRVYFARNAVNELEIGRAWFAHDLLHPRELASGYTKDCDLTLAKGQALHRERRDILACFLQVIYT